ncbi:copper chaperone PCu(A)C [Vibrio sp. JPW-9-11-11]|uniref:copper chaperone PCu(A)C n=1 Tax=Vibrio sp. JPW-9-11-11 TaxID=1416532 RepID=UPI001593F4E7|nr:copper chaperone PCu(A)C [Vibrio sp. JPW-9-11-11]NVD08813.1 copper chaperone PCu(A)C [Vibrio sp. JPW-9-11-11]
MKLKALLLTTLMLSPFAYAKTDIMTHHAYARATPPNAPTSAVFLEIMNRGDNDRYIVSATTPAAAKVELHDVIKEGDVMKMRQIERIQVPAKGKAVLKPGSLHIMLFELQQPFVEGEQIDVQITFADGEQQTFSAPIKKVMSGMKHH